MCTHFDVFPEILDGSVRILIIRPFRAIHRDFPRVVVTMQWNLCKVLHFVHISLANGFALSSVVSIVARDGGGDAEEDEPVPRG